MGVISQSIPVGFVLQELKPFSVHPFSPNSYSPPPLRNKLSISCLAEKSPTSTATAITTSWSEFARNVSGEWDGFGADFTREGNPIELPESVVPEAYREWEVKVFDWQTQCPTIARLDHSSITYKIIKLLPTVGCEADAATVYSIDEKSIASEESHGVIAFAYQSNGSYVALWPIEDCRNGVEKIIELEYCLINPQDQQSRVRIVQVVRVLKSKMELKSVRVFCEQWYGPFRNGEQLGGCSIRDSAFASTPRTSVSQVACAWQTKVRLSKFSSSQNNNIRELVDEDEKTERLRDKCGLILLPKQLWCSFKATEEGELCSEAGWLLDNKHAITSTCLFSRDANVKEIAIALETAIPEESGNSKTSNHE